MYVCVSVYMSFSKFNIVNSLKVFDEVESKLYMFLMCVHYPKIMFINALSHCEFQMHKLDHCYNFIKPRLTIVHCSKIITLF